MNLFSGVLRLKDNSARGRALRTRRLWSHTKRRGGIRRKDRSRAGDTLGDFLRQVCPVRRLGFSPICHVLFQSCGLLGCLFRVWRMQEATCTSEGILAIERLVSHSCLKMILHNNGVYFFRLYKFRIWLSLLQILTPASDVRAGSTILQPPLVTDEFIYFVLSLAQVVSCILRDFKFDQHASSPQAWRLSYDNPFPQLFGIRSEAPNPLSAPALKFFDSK